MLHCNMTTTMETVMADGKSAPAAPAAKTGVAVAKSATPAKQTVKAAAPVEQTPQAATAPAVSQPAMAASAIADAPAKPATAKAAAPVVTAKPAMTGGAAPAIKAKPVTRTQKPAVSRPAPAKSTAAPQAAVTQKGMMTTMNEQVKKVTAETTDRVQAMFGDVNARAKTAMEKGAKLFEEMNELNKGNLEAVVESGKIAAKGMQTMGQDAAELTRKSFESATTAMKSFASVKSPTELFKLQSDYAKSALETMVAESAKASEAWLKLAGEVAQPISNRYSVAAEKLKSASL